MFSLLGVRAHYKDKIVDINWIITADDTACVKAIVEEQRNKELVLDRYKRNLADTKPP
jgi:hypothetical protein